MRGMTTAEIEKRMVERGVSPGAIKHFLSCREAVLAGDTSCEQLDWQDIVPFSDADVKELDKGQRVSEHYREIGEKNLQHAVVIKLNGGRSTSMGGAIPKCFVEAKAGKSFLDLCMQRIMHLNDTFKVEIPLVLMNSFFTNEVTKEIVGRTPLMIFSFIQNEYPRIHADNLVPLNTGKEEDWCPAGHGDFYISFYESGLLDTLLNLGYRWVFISNIDNLCADISPVILGMMIEHGHDFMMEVTRKTAVDVKGGAPAFIKGHPGLVEIAQVGPEHVAAFQDIDTFRYFNTNNLWIDMEAIRDLLQKKKLKIPTILNPKTILGHSVLQIETAMGAAMGSFSRPAAISVPRSRFFPVKKMKDLLILQSDAFRLNGAFEIFPNIRRPPTLPFLPDVTFSGGFMADNELRNWFSDPAALSFVEAESVKIEGNIFFEGETIFRGRVNVVHQGAGELRIPAGTVLSG